MTPVADLDQLLAQVCARGCVPTAYFAVFGQHTEMIIAERGLPRELSVSRATPLVGALSALAANGLARVDGRQVRDPDTLLRCRQFRARSIVAVPVRVEDEVVGALVALARRPRDFEPAFLSWAASAANDAAAAIAHYVPPTPSGSWSKVQVAMLELDAIARLLSAPGVSPAVIGAALAHLTPLRHSWADLKTALGELQSTLSKPPRRMERSAANEGNA